MDKEKKMLHLLSVDDFDCFYAVGIYSSVEKAKIMAKRYHKTHSDAQDYFIQSLPYDTFPFEPEEVILTYNIHFEG